ncbi:urea carboxylase system permease [Actinoplanes campanulatus]|uniref:Urea carboxylase system permease n=1 Tax=Actinoplanes campanulatus TaxID=113559 RepID=A0A7W5FK25_9ACTN|nr:amino acid permease [Actinoplanes campanulatus]MBB3101217.1 urea carboxylase system permease [Actinoplanes campanulatus]GGN51965.1 putative amino-acid permease [Actinoplanes campanulatus]GID41964.1 putative amino-acid permease [Actinoplanes campanulatus]
MSTTPTLPAPPPSADADAADLRDFGYEPQLRRGIGSYASFAAGFSFVSILTTVFQLFAFGFSFGGPAFFWTWPLVFLGQFMVALNFAELAARYPLSGCIYQWSRRLANATVGWFAGWVMIIAQIVTVAAAAIALQVVLPRIWSGFQLVGGDPSLTSTSGATNAVILGSILIALTTLVNVVGVRLMAIVNSTGVTLEIIGVAAVIILLLFNIERGPGVVFDTGGTGDGLSYVGPFLVSALMAAYVVVGFDSAGELSEETRDPRHTAPRTILRALAASGIGGGLMLLVALMAAPSLDDGRLATEGLPYVLMSRLGETGGRILLIDVAIAVAVCTLAIQTAGSRMIFSMARDGVLPFSAALSRVGPRTGTPALPAIVVGAGAAAVLLVNIGQAALFTALTSVCIVMLYLAYALVTIPLLVRRIKGWPHGLETTTTERGGKLFGLGRAGVVVNVLAVVYGIGMILNLGWPRQEVYDPSGEHWYLHYFSLIFVGGALLAGTLAYLRYRTRAVAPHTRLPFTTPIPEGETV